MLRPTGRSLTVFCLGRQDECLVLSSANFMNIKNNIVPEDALGRDDEKAPQCDPRIFARFN